jgi:hypothetical protein
LEIDLKPEVEAYIAESIRSGAFASVNEFIEEVTRKQMLEEAGYEQKVLEGLSGPFTPLTESDLR